MNPKTNIRLFASTLCCWILACYTQAEEPLLIPNDASDTALDAPHWPSWPAGMPQQDLPSHVEREYKLAVPDWTASVEDLAADIDAFLREAVDVESWQAPPLVKAEGQSGYTIRDTSMQEKVFSDFYFDSHTLLNWRHGVAYRLRQRFENESDWRNYMAGTDGSYPTRVEFMTKIHSQTVAGSPGLTEVEEYRFKTQNALGREALPEMMTFFSIGRVPYDFEYKNVRVRRGDVGNPAWALVEFYRRNDLTESAFHNDGRFAFTPHVYVKTKRRRQHLVYAPSQRFQQLVDEDQESFQAFIISVDHAHAWRTDEIMAYVTGETSIFPEPRGEFVEVELEFDRSTAARIDRALVAAQQESRKRELIAIKEAFTTDLAHLKDLLEERFHTEPKHRSKYHQARNLAYPNWHLGVVQSGLTLKHVPAEGGHVQVLSFTPEYDGPMAVEIRSEGSVTASLFQKDTGTHASGEGQVVLLQTDGTARQLYELHVAASALADRYELRLFCPDAFDELQPTSTLEIVPGISCISDLSLISRLPDTFRIRSPRATVVEFHCHYSGNDVVKLDLFENDSGQRVGSSTPETSSDGVARMAVHLDSNHTYALRIDGANTSPCTYALIWDCQTASEEPRQEHGLTISRCTRDVIAIDLGPVEFTSSLQTTDSLGSGRWDLASPFPLPRDVAFRVFERVSHRQGFFRRAQLSAGPSDLVLNEVSSVNSVGDFVELHNRSKEPFVFEENTWSIKDENDGRGYLIPGGTVIPAGGFLLVDSEELGFGFGGTDMVRLYRGATVHDATSWKGHVQSRGRFPDGGPWVNTDVVPTPGMANTPQLTSGYSESF